MKYYTEPIERLIDEFKRLPGVGGKSAQRLAFHVINMPEENVVSLSQALLEAKRNVKYCSICCNLTENDPCSMCKKLDRDTKTIMVVEDPRDMAAYERTHEFKGLYHILHGTISPMAGTTPSDIKIKELLSRLQGDEVSEIIIATNPTVEGEATAMYIHKLISPLGVKVTRIANGVPVGGDLEYVDEVTLLRALEGRREM